MFHRVLIAATLVALGVTFGATQPASAQDFAVDPAHAGITFKISHMGLSWIQGRFDEFGGNFTIDTTDPSKCAFELAINPASIDTNNKQRDDHLRSPDFLNTKQFPKMTFKSTSVRAVKGGYEVTGDFTMHGVTQSMTLELVGGRSAEFPKGVQRTGYSTEFAIKRSDFGITKFSPGVGEKVFAAISFEGIHK